MTARTGKGELSRDKKKLLLAILIFILALSLVYRILNPYEQERAASLTYTGERAEKSAKSGGKMNAGGDTELSLIRLDLLTHPTVHSGRTTRDIFRSAGLARSEKEPPKQVAPPDEKKEMPAGKGPPVVDQRVKVQEELSRFRTFGYLDKGEDRVLFLERDNDILVIRKGDRIDGKYLVVEITDKLLTLRAEEINEDVKIDLSQF